MKKYKKSYKNMKFKILTPTWNKKFELPYGSSSVSDIQDYFNYIIKKHETVTYNLPIRIYVNQIEKRITFRIKTGYCLELLTSETLLGSPKRLKMKNDKSVPRLEITKVVLVYCNIVNNEYQPNSRVLPTFVPNMLFGQLLDISSETFMFRKTFNSGFSCIEVWFTDKNSKLLQMQD